MNNRTLPGRAHRDHGRTAHFLPNKRIGFCQANYRPTKRTVHTPKDQDVLATHRTEPKKPPNSHYQNILSDNKYHKKDLSKKVEVKSKVNEISHRKEDFKYTDRYLNREPIIDKRMNLTYHELSGVDRSHTDQSFKKELRNNGVNPVSVKLYKHPITHDHKGRGHMILNNSSTRTQQYKEKIEKMGVRTARGKNIWNKVR